MILTRATPPTSLGISDISASPDRLLPILPSGRNLFYLDSATEDKELCQYSFIGWDPFLILELSCGGSLSCTAWDGEPIELGSTDPFDALRELLRKCRLPSSDGLPMHGGGAVGIFSYDLRRYIEQYRHALTADLDLPLLRIGFYDSCLRYDHFDKTYSVSAANLFAGRASAQTRIDQIHEILLAASAVAEHTPHNRALEVRNNGDGEAPRFTGSFTKQEYVQAIESAIEHIRAGDIFQVNLAQRFQIPLSCGGRELYRELRQRAASPFAAYLELPETEILSASPERFIRVKSGMVETRPIKGTRPRGTNDHEDRRLLSELMASAKETSENVMIVDVERNDLGRVCKIGSVRVPKLLETETFMTVHHLISEVTGELREDADIVDLLRAAFPGGSISGAPKIRAMEIIDELEHCARGLYTGSMGYIDFIGNTDLNIIIRTLIIHKGTGYLHVGGGIVADSDPESEYDETMLKAKAIFEAIAAVEPS